MDNEPLTIEQPSSQNGLHMTPLTGLLLVVLAFAIALLGYWLGVRQSSGPGDGSPEVGFTRDMLTHHAQAVDMANLLRDRTQDPDMKLFALDIVLTQQAQIGQMQGWLAVWGYPIASTTPAMEWMGMPTTGRMPGMASPEQMNQLREMNGTEAEALFLELMIVHHRAGVAMAEAVLAQSERPEVLALARSIVEAQSSEVDYMQELLQQRGYPPVPEEPYMNHDEAAPQSTETHESGGH
ncbi:MAG: DUF305 domain-containing protein [Anaerolineaceae bacterium]|nr:DUF305 domain-containing protein [Anaerolineaceae bacterium]